VRNNLQQILESAQSATETVRWIHQFGRTSTAHTDSEKELFNLSDLVEEAVEICKFWSRAELERTGARIKYEVGLAEDCFVEGIPDQISWVALNILKNAVEALPNGGRIKVKSYVEKNLAILRVEDNGIGIKLEEINNLTQAFWTSKEGHAGMGLTFNSEIIRRHKGKMGIKRMKPHGTCFVVRLPVAINRTKNGRPRSDELSERGFRILLIEDDERVLRILEEGLKLLGQQTVCAMSVEEGLKILHQTEVDAIVCELAMPDKSGWEAAAAVREVFLEKNMPKAPFIALMGYAGPEQDEMDPSTGVDRVMAKPIKVPQLLEIITQEIGKESAGGAFSGKVDKIDLLEYVQLLLLNGRRIVLEVSSTEGMKGHIFVDRGEILHAICGDLRGEDALYKCLTFKSGTFSTLPWQEPEEVTINKSAMFLLVEAARKKDDMRFKLIQSRESNRQQVAPDLGVGSTIIVK
jgi:CheY-like chemotaxis protein